MRLHVICKVWFNISNLKNTFSAHQPAIGWAVSTFNYCSSVQKGSIIYWILHWALVQIICVYSPDKLISIVWLLHASISLSASKVLVKNKCVNKYLNSFWHIIHSQKLVKVNFLILAYFNLVNLFFFWNWILAFITFFLTLLLFYLKVQYIFLNFYCNKLVSLFQYSSKDKHPGTRYFLLKIYIFLVIMFTSFILYFLNIPC